jgi:hypothetical protein
MMTPMLTLSLAGMGAHLRVVVTASIFARLPDVAPMVYLIVEWLKHGDAGSC